MATELQLDIVTPMKSAFSGTVRQVILPAWEGEEGALPDHDTELALLRGGVCTVISEQGEQRWAVGRGFAEISGTAVTLLTDSAELQDEVDKAAARTDYTQAEQELASADWTSEQANLLRAAMEVAQARIDV